jgi:hypothetical protein
MRKGCYEGDTQQGNRQSQPATTYEFLRVKDYTMGTGECVLKCAAITLQYKLMVAIRVT